MTPDIMSASLRMHPCETERHVKDEALCSDGLDKYDKEGFLDLLTRVNCHSIPKHDEVRHCALSIGHKEFIQKHKYALDAIASIANHVLMCITMCSVIRVLFYDNLGMALAFVNMRTSPLKHSNRSSAQ